MMKSRSVEGGKADGQGGVVSGNEDAGEIQQLCAIVRVPCAKVATRVCGLEPAGRCC